LLTEVKNCTPKPYFYIFVAHFLYSDSCNYKSIMPMGDMFPNTARKPRNQCKPQQLCVDFRSRGQFCCIDGLKNASPRALSMRFGYGSKFLFELGDGPICSWQVSANTRRHIRSCLNLFKSPLISLGHFTLLTRSWS